MTNRAELHHSIPGRTRLRLPARRGDGAYFARLSAALETIPGISEVRVNTRIGGIVLLHPGAEPKQIFAWASENGWFHLDDAYMRPSFFLEVASRDVAAAIRQLRALGGVDLRAVLFVILMGMGISQTLRGQIAAPAITLFWYALSMMGLAEAE